MQCALCGHGNDASIVVHIREKHDLKVYQSLFPDLPVVTRDLFTAIENAVFFGYVDDTQGLDTITPEEREMILVSARNNAHLRSEILITPDF
jgi:hypothetical protein